MEPKQFLNLSPSYIMGVKEHKGNLFGVELELEGRNVGLRDVATRGWNRHEDGSLRGEAIEYTTAGAKSLDESKQLVTDLFNKFEKNKVVFNDSIRTSTHVHLNFCDKPIKQAINFFSLFTVIEEVLQHYSGEDRKGNLFCIGTRDADGIIGILASGIARGSLDGFAGDRYKYAACNLSTLYKFGTIEVRTMRGATSAEQVNRWLDILNDMYEYSIRMVSPAELVNSLSILTAEGLLRSVFKPENYVELMKSWPKIYNLHQSLMEGARLIQLYAYEFDEAFKEKVEIKEAVVGERLPRVILEGRWRGHNYQIYRPDGHSWNVTPNHRRGFWEDGDRVSDEQRIEWNQERQRFIVRYANGDIYECNWRRHHRMVDEGPGLHRNMPPGPGRGAEAEPMFEEDEEREDFED
jgi:hypothetical protein